MGTLRIGAAALLAGAMSVGTAVAVAIRGWNLDDLRDTIKQDGRAAFEKFLSENYGFLTGRNPDAAMLDFLDYAERVQKATTSSTP